MAARKTKASKASKAGKSETETWRPRSLMDRLAEVARRHGEARERAKGAATQDTQPFV